MCFPEETQADWFLQTPVTPDTTTSVTLSHGVLVIGGPE